MDTPICPELVHQLHDVKGFLMRHLAGFQQSVYQGLTAGCKLVLIACDLLGHTDLLYKDAVALIDGDALRIVDVVDDDVALGTSYNTDIVADTGCAGLYIGQQAVLQNQGDGIGQVHARIGLDRVAVDAFDRSISEHTHKVQGIDTQIEQGTAQRSGRKIRSLRPIE